MPGILIGEFHNKGWPVVRWWGEAQEYYPGLKGIVCVCVIDVFVCSYL